MSTEHRRALRLSYFCRDAEIYNQRFYMHPMGPVTPAYVR